jgi:hypothetical protein
MTDKSFSPLWKKHCQLSCIIGTILLILYSITLFKIDDDAVAQYYKAKESRRSKIKKAKDQKEAVRFTQERTGISRNLWIEEEEGPRRQFFLKAVSAMAHASKDSKKTGLKELYDKPKGWFQEELYWEISDTGEKVMPQDGIWIRQTPPHQKIPENLVQKIVPVQRVRFFDAASGEWDPVRNTMTASGAFFSILKVMGHELPKNEHEGEIIARGTAAKIIFSFDKNGRKQVACRNVKLHLNQGNSK